MLTWLAIGILETRNTRAQSVGNTCRSFCRCAVWHYSDSFTYSRSPFTYSRTGIHMIESHTLRRVYRPIYVWLVYRALWIEKAINQNSYNIFVCRVSTAEQRHCRLSYIGNWQIVRII